ncbi:MAG: mannosyltransferase [Leptospiraceae bacterium]|nr:MAG: mannosyltransferase [Leptospiraceae bacterium]GIX43482.1 MAG: mannosyltransferase [Leptospiraceae bacterium]
MSNHLNIYFDARMIGYSGIGTQIEEVISRLYQNSEIHLTLIGNKNKIQSIFPFINNIIEFNAPIYSLKEQFFFPAKSSKEGIFHFPHYNAPIKHLKQSIVIIHDLIHLDSEEFKKLHYRFYAKTLISQILKKAKAIITVSEYTKKRLQEEFHTDQNNIFVNYNGINQKVFYPATKKEILEFKIKYQLPDKFLLVVGIGKKHKNLDGLLLALKELWKKQHLLLPLVIAGTNKKIPEYVKPIIDEEIKQWIFFLPFIPKEELRILYSSAFLFLMPSKLEGFGFPLLEAMACNVPTISSNRASLPEIGGDATIYFDPYSIQEIQKTILKVCNDANLRKDLIRKGKSQVKKFSWDQHVKKLIEIYKKYY